MQLNLALCKNNEKQFVDIEELMVEIIDGDKNNKTELLFKTILERWVYFFFNETNDSDTKPGKGNVDVVLFTNEENPILVPLIENDQGTNGVVYTNSKLAVKSAEFNCKVGKMKGKNAFKMFYEMKNLNSVFIQSNHGYIHPTRQELAKLAGQNA